MTIKDVASVCSLLNAYLVKFKVAPRFTEEEIKHWMIPIKDVVYSYVAEVISHF